MKRLLVGALALSLLGGTGIASAQFYGYDPHNRGYYDSRHRDWRRGDRVNRNEWRRWQNVDWRRQHLNRPYRGYEWRRYGDNYFLVSVSDGHISAVVRVR